MENQVILEFENFLTDLKPDDVYEIGEVFDNIKQIINFEGSVSIEICREFMNKIHLSNHTFNDLLQISLSYLCLFKCFTHNLRIGLVEIIKNLYEKVFFGLSKSKMGQLLEVTAKIEQFFRFYSFDDLANNFDELYNHLKINLTLIIYFFEYYHNIMSLDSLVKKSQKIIIKAQQQMPSQISNIMEKIMGNFPSYVINNFKINDDEESKILDKIMYVYRNEISILTPEIQRTERKLKSIFPILEVIDQEIVQTFCLETILSNDSYLKMMKKTEEIFQKYEEILEGNVESYKNTRYGEIPEIEYVLSKFIIQLLDKDIQKEISQTLQILKNSNKSISFRRTFERLLILPIEVQYIISEVLLTLSDDPSSILRYSLRLEFENQPAKIIPDDWAQTFIERACSSPFIEVLSKFNKNCLILPEDISEATKKIIIIGLPQNLSGLNLHNGSIVINSYDSNFPKEITFAVYLHELSHYLLRKDCLTIADHMQNKCFESEEISSNEAGEFFEKILFGEILKEITYHAADYLLNLPIPQDVKSFKDEFLRLNQNKSSGYAKLKGSKKFVIGHCGFKKIRRK